MIKDQFPIPVGMVTHMAVQTQLRDTEERTDRVV